MKTATQIQADRMVWRPLAALANALGGKREAALPEDVQCIVVCKFKGLGSIVQATPLLQALRQRHPRARIVFVSSAGNEQMLKMIPTVDEVLGVDERSWGKLMASLRGVRKRLRALKPQAFINLEIHSHFSAVFARQSGAALRLGFHCEGQPHRLGLYSQELPFDPDAPLSQMYFSFAALLGSQELESPLFGFPQVRATRPESLPAAAPLWVLNPNASDGRLERRWPAERFAQLAIQLLALFPQGMVAFTGSKAERDYVEGIVQKVADRRAVNTAGQLDMPGLMGLLRSATLFVTNDTGPMHLAFAMGVPTVALFGPVAPWKYHLPPHVRAVYQPVRCSPCLHRHLLPSCGGDNICMKGVPVERVLEVVNRHLGHSLR